MGPEAAVENSSKSHACRIVSGRFDFFSCSVKMKVLSCSVYSYKHNMHFGVNGIEFVRTRVSEDKNHQQ